MGTTRNNWLAAGDPLRGLAAFGVLLFHIATWAAIDSNRDVATSDLGPAGHVLFNLDASVFLFLLLSGYLIGRPFASAFVLQTPFPRVGRYLVRRTLRLGPGALAALAFAILLFGTHFTRGTVHFWTLGAEACFYAVLPLLTVVVLRFAAPAGGPRTRAVLWVAATGVLSVGSLWFRQRGTPVDYPHQHEFPSIAFAFAPGVALAGLEPLLAPAVRVAPKPARVITRALVMGSALAGAAYFLAPSAHFMQRSVLAVGACAALLAAVVVRDWAGLPAWRLLDNRPLQWLGARSYSLYLFHLPIVAFVAARVATDETLPAGAGLVALIAIPLSLVFAAAGYALVERPFMRTTGSLGALKRNAATIDVSPVGR
jgi:peptidoglycan/LPS O-acetylase OafA/YrhL